MRRTYKAHVTQTRQLLSTTPARCCLCAFAGYMRHTSPRHGEPAIHAYDARSFQRQQILRSRRRLHARDL